MRRRPIRCFYCGEETYINRRKVDGSPHPRMRTKDHLIPKAKGGGNCGVGGTPNKVIACFECNQAKADLSYREFLEKRGVKVDSIGPLAEAIRKLGAEKRKENKMKYEVKPIRTIQGYIKGFAIYDGSERIDVEPFWSEPGKVTQAYNQAADYCNWLNSENEEMS